MKENRGVYPNLFHHFLFLLLTTSYYLLELTMPEFPMIPGYRIEREIGQFDDQLTTSNYLPAPWTIFSI
jgi:hypothetical protein